MNENEYENEDLEIVNSNEYKRGEWSSQNRPFIKWEKKKKYNFNSYDYLILFFLAIMALISFIEAFTNERSFPYLISMFSLIGILIILRTNRID